MSTQESAARPQPSRAGGGGRHRRRGGNGERAMAPEPEFTSYYGRPVIKKPVWKTPDVPAYFFLGGLAGSSAVMAALADATARPALARVGRLAAAGGAMAGTGALIHDLGRPDRFLNMLRVFRPTSPLSMGSWLLAAFSGVAGAAAASEVTRVAPRTGAVMGAGAAVLGAPLATYTAVLVADTAVPSWHEARAHLPFVFASSSAASAGGLGLVAAPMAESLPARRLAVAGAALSAGTEQLMDRRLGFLAEPYHQGRPGRLMKTARALTVAGGIGALLSGRSRLASALSGGAVLAGTLCTRFGVFEAGIASAEDPKYTVVPQRERIGDGR